MQAHFLNDQNMQKSWLIFSNIVKIEDAADLKYGDA